MKKRGYFEHGFLEEDPNLHRPKPVHRIGWLDVCILVLGVICIWLGWLVLKSEDGLRLLQTSLRADMQEALDNTRDIRYFLQNRSLTSRLYHETAAAAMILTMAGCVLMMLHALIKRQGVGVPKAVALMLLSMAQAVLCVGYYTYFLAQQQGLMEVGLTRSLLRAAGAAMLAVGVLWFIFMFLWGWISFFETFSTGALALLLLLNLVALVLIVFHLLLMNVAGIAADSRAAMLKMFETPGIMAIFMLMSLLAVIEDYRAKYLPEEDEKDD